MDMKLDPQKIRQLREARGWSQEHLAEVAGLSARTVQRIEAEGNASPESRMALATALGLDAADLGVAGPATPANETAATPAAGTAASRSDDWRRHLAIYLLVCGGLLALNLSQHGAITWSKWPLLGWGLGLLLHRLRRHRR